MDAPPRASYPMSAGNFPKPWTVKGNGESFWVEAANGAKFAFTYHRSPHSTPSPAYHSEDDARRLTAAFAKLGQ